MRRDLFKQSNNKRDTFFKLIFLLLGMLLVQLLLFLVIEYYMILNNAQESAMNNGNNKSLERQQVFQEFLDGQSAVLYALKNNKQFIAFLNGETNDAKDTFLTAASSNVSIMQLRYIDKHGHEKIRIDRKAHGSEAFINDDLQDKSKRGYFIDSTKAKLNETFFSALDLNVEYGKVQVPFKPTVRVMLPIGKDDKFEGVLVLNLFMEHFLKTWVRAPLYEITVYDEKGYSILHHNKTKNWGEYLSTPHRIEDDYPESYKDILSHKTLRTSEHFSKHLELTISNKLIFVMKLNKKHLKKVQDDYKQQIILMFVVMFLLALLTSYFVAREIYKLFSIVEKEKEKAQNATKTKSEFLANMSHEIRTPMNGILGFVENLAKHENDPQKIQKFETIRNSGNQLLSVINDILDFSKIESGKLDIELQPCKIKLLLKDTANIFAQLADEKNIDFECITRDSVPECILGDEVRIRQVVFNLLSNAIKFTPKGGKITLKAEYDAKLDDIKISVTDNGVGIAQEKLQNIFEAFTQEDVSTTRKFGGTGLGLSISSKLIKMMDGTLHVESELGKGSTFYFHLPVTICDLELNQENNTYVNDIEVEHHLEGHILVVEDNKTNQMLIGVILDDLGLSYDIANDGVEALDKYTHNSYDIILMDENMPNMSGIEATRQIRELEKTNSSSSIPIVAVTANAMVDDRERFLQAGMDDYLSKPYTEDDITKVLQKYL